MNVTLPVFRKTLPAGSRKPLNLYDGKWAVEVFQKQMLFDEISVDLSGLGKGNCNGNFPGDSRHNFDATGTIHQHLFIAIICGTLTQNMKPCLRAAPVAEP